MIRVIHGDCFEEMRKLDAESVDAVVTDPPYGLEFMGKAWDSLSGDAWRTGGTFTKPGIGERETAWPSFGSGDTANATCATCGGRMRGAKRCECAAPDWRVKGLPLGESRVDSRMAQGRKMQEWHHIWAVEALRVLKPGGYLLAFGGTRTYHRLACGIEDAGFEIRDSLHYIYGSGFPKSLNLPNGLGTALKPAHEPIVLARKALAGTVAATVEKYGTGALNVDASRVAAVGESLDGGRISTTTDGWDRPWKHDAEAIEAAKSRGAEAVAKAEQLGRWPPNLILSHAPECVEGGACAEDCAVAEMDRQSGGTTSSGAEQTIHRKQHSPSVNPSGIGGIGASVSFVNYADSGGASRFFPVFRYEAKPSRAERNAGVSGPEKPLRWSAGDQAPGTFQSEGTHRAARNHHPTVKPIALMAWLVQLVARPGQVVLDPFAGSFTTMIACQRLGIDGIGIEREEEYVAIGRARLRGDSPLFSSVTP